MSKRLHPTSDHPHHDGWEELDHPVVVISYDEWNRLHNAIAEPIRNIAMIDAGGGSTGTSWRHAVLDEFRAAPSDPPYLLHEGWADSQSGLDAGALARNALDFRERNPSVRLRDLVGLDQYHLMMNPASYELGGAFVDFLIRRYGVARFLRLYNEGRPATFDATCLDLFGSDLDALEAEFWEDVRRQVEGFSPADRVAVGDHETPDRLPGRQTLVAHGLRLVAAFIPRNARRNSSVTVLIL